MKEEPVFAVEKNNECYKCGEKPIFMGIKRSVTSIVEVVEKHDTTPECVA